MKHLTLSTLATAALLTLAVSGTTMAQSDNELRPTGRAVPSDRPDRTIVAPARTERARSSKPKEIVVVGGKPKPGPKAAPGGPTDLAQPPASEDAGNDHEWRYVPIRR